VIEAAKREAGTTELAIAQVDATGRVTPSKVLTETALPSCRVRG